MVRVVAGLAASAAAVARLAASGGAAGGDYLMQQPVELPIVQRAVAVGFHPQSFAALARRGQVRGLARWRFAWASHGVSGMSRSVRSESYMHRSWGCEYTLRCGSIVITITPRHPRGHCVPAKILRPSRSTMRCWSAARTVIVLVTAFLTVCETNNSSSDSSTSSHYWYAVTLCNDRVPAGADSGPFTGCSSEPEWHTSRPDLRAQRVPQVLRPAA